MKTKTDVTVNFRGFGEIVVPKGTKLTNRTATGIDEKYHFVDEFEWIDKNYPTINNLLKHDAIYYGINIPDEYVEY
jgi:hypothetical protein